MALDGIAVKALCDELNNSIVGGRIRRIAQPEKEELIITVKSKDSQYRLLISANASLPLCYLTEENKVSPPTAPNFCMLLRKHIGNARISKVNQPGLERVLCLHLEHLNEMGDPAFKRLYIELMGKHSNIIFCDENDVIIDSIKHVGAMLSSVREVLPGRDYFVPDQRDRLDALTISKEEFYNKVLSRPQPVDKALSASFVGFSRIAGVELAERCNIDADLPLQALHEDEWNMLYEAFLSFVSDIKNSNFNPCIVYNESGSPLEFAAFSLTCYKDMETETNSSISYVLSEYYKKRNLSTNIKQKTTDLRKIIQTHLDRARRKLTLQEKQLKDTDKKDKLKVYGELLHTYGYDAKPGDKSITVINYYDNNEITIPLDPTLDPMENAKVYFEKYDKYKRTYDAIIPQMEETKASIEHLLSIEASLLIAENESDINAIRKELSEYGYIKKNHSSKQKEKRMPPLHFVTKDDFHIYVGKNNYQNEEVTFKIATGNDWWFHAKQMPGSHVILKNDGREIPDHVFEIAASLAGFYSYGRESDKVEIDYVQKKQVKKTPGGAPGFVIYYTNYSMTVHPDDSGVQRLS